MLLVQKLAEEKIRAAIDRGEFEDLPGKGKPLVLDDNSSVPDELRVGYRLLKNAGYLPPELELRKEIQHIENLLHHVDSSVDEKALMKRLSLLRVKLAKQGNESSCLALEGRYREKLLSKVCNWNGKR